MALVLPLFLASHSNAQQIDNSGNLINNNSWSGATYGVDPGGCCASISGSGALYDTRTDTIMFSYGQDTLTQTIGLQQALGGTGIQVHGYNYSFDYRLMPNSGPHTDNLTASIWLTTSSGFNTEATHLFLSGQVASGVNDQWNNISGTRNFELPYTDPQSVTMRLEGRDGGFWAGYYGPEVRNISLSVNYSFDPCASDPLYSSSCPGYLEAYMENLFSLLGSSSTPEPETEMASIDYSLPTTTLSATPEETTSGEVKVDAGGIEVSTTGELTIPGDASKETVEQKQAVEEKKEEKKVTVDYSLIAMVVRQATDLTNVMSVVNQSIMQSTESQVPASSSSGEEIAITTESVKTTQESTINNVVTSQDNNNQQTTVAVETKTTQQTTVQQTRAQPNEAASGGVSMNDFAKAPADFSAYQTQLADASFYAPKEIYKGQVNVDNRRVMKGLGSDRLHQEMVRQQYQ